MKKTLLAFLILSSTARAGYDVATFADTGLISGVNQYNNNSGGFTSGGQYFNNTYNSAFGGYWNGFSVSSTTDTTTPGYTNQYSAITGSGNGSAYYAVLYPTAYVNLTGIVQSIDLTNTTYAYLSMLNGDSFESAFTKGSFFDVVITGYSGLNNTGTQTGSVTYFLADYTSDTSTPVNTWNTVNLTSLGSAESLGFSFQSSATGEFGINTPEYVAVDNLVTLLPSSVSEPSSWLLCLTGIGIGALVRRLRLARITRV
jgi:hypothetical protein